MYGLVNDAIRDLVLSAHGPAAWESVCEAAGAPREYGKMEPYPDEVTYNLVGAASVKLGVAPDELMWGFGEHWVLQTAEKGYGPLLRLWGSSYIEFLSNLDELHARVSETFTRLRPPSFRVETLSPERIRVHYVSERRGLAPFVMGLLSGLGKRFDTAVTITHEESRDAGAPHDVFGVRIGAV